MNIQHHLDAAWALINAELAENGAVAMMAVLCRDNEIFFLPSGQFPSKAAFAYVLPQAVENTQADTIVMITEAWMASVDESELEHMVAPSVHPKRIEVVMVTWKTKDGIRGSDVRLLIRDADNKPSVGGPVPGGLMGGTDRFLDPIFATVH